MLDPEGVKQWGTTKKFQVRHKALSAGVNFGLTDTVYGHDLICCYVCLYVLLASVSVMPQPVANM